VKRVVILVAALVLAADAAGKRWAGRVEACGESRCATVAGDGASRVAELTKRHEGWGVPFWRGEPRRAPFYEVVVDRGTRSEWSFLYVPAARAVRIDDPDDGAPSFWRTTAPVLRVELARLVGRVSPKRSRYPAS
jgi:hypothetical protein